jgi:hypothetical protein
LRTFFAAAAALSLIAFVAGCAATNPLTGRPVTAADVKAAARLACAVVPTAEQVTAAVDAGNKTAATIEAVARILCAGIVAPAPVTPVAPLAPAAPAAPAPAPAAPASESAG